MAMSIDGDPRRGLRRRLETPAGKGGVPARPVGSVERLQAARNEKVRPAAPGDTRSPRAFRKKSTAGSPVQ